MMGNTVFNRNNQNLANENLRAQYKIIEDSSYWRGINGAAYLFYIW